MEQEQARMYVIVRTYSAGVFAGELVAQEGREIALTNARRIWYWEGAETLSEMAMFGVRAPERCKFACPITTEILLTEAIEVIVATPEARASIEGVPQWRAGRD